MKKLGGTTVTLGDRTFDLVPSFRGIVSCEEKLGTTLTEIILGSGGKTKAVSISHVATVFWAWSFKDGEEVIGLDDMGEILINNSWSLQIPVMIQLVHAAIAGVSYDEIYQDSRKKKKAPQWVPKRSPRLKARLA